MPDFITTTLSHWLWRNWSATLARKGEKNCYESSVARWIVNPSVYCSLRIAVRSMSLRRNHVVLAHRLGVEDPPFRLPTNDRSAEPLAHRRIVVALPTAVAANHLSTEPR